MHIIHIAAELAPIAKVGGLADVLLGLCRELSWKGHDVDIILPKYDCMDSNDVRDLTIINSNLETTFDGEKHLCTIWMGWVENLRVYFVEPHHPRLFFNRGCFYGCEDDIDRFLYFSRLAIEFIFQAGLKPQIVHIHDWQTAIIPLLYAESYKQKGMAPAKFMLTVHNFDYQGKCRTSDLDRICLDGAKYLKPDELQDPHDKGLINLLKGGLVYADYTTTVSPTYSEEVKRPSGGCGLSEVINSQKDRFSGILNGLDYSYWNPEIDRFLPAHFSSREFPANKKDRNTLDKKGYLKKLFRERLFLAEDHRPIIASVTRLVPQKGVELIKHGLYHALSKGAQFVLLGSTAIPEIANEFHALKHKFDGHPHVHIILHHQEELAHLIFAAADMLIVPSIFEPCGLTQLIALKYGAIPIVRKTGGLADTIFDVDDPSVAPEKGNGYVFIPPEGKALASAMDRAIDCWFHQPDRWRKMMIHGMNIDYSWNVSSNKYLELYTELVAKSK